MSSITPSMTAAQIDAIITADPSQKAFGVQILAERYTRKSAKGRKPRWKSVVKLAEYLGYDGASTREAISKFLDSKLSTSPAPAPAKPKPSAPAPALAFTSDWKAAMGKLTKNQLTMAKVAMATLTNDAAQPARRKAATTTLRNYGVLV
jgi:hypothetical protein